MRNAGLEEAQAGIKIAGRNINNLRYADNMESEKVGLKLNIQKTKIMASGPGNRWGNSRNSVRLYFGGPPKSLQMMTAAMKLKDAYSLEGKL